MEQVITNADREVLRETYRNANRAVESIYSMISRIEDEDLALDLNRQVCRYTAISDKAEEALLHAGHCPESHDLRNLMHHLSMQGKSMRDRTPAHIAELVIRENRRDLARTRQVLRENQNARKEYYEMADELMAFEESSIAKLRDYI